MGAGVCLPVVFMWQIVFDRSFLFKYSFDWHQLICADAKLLLVMGIDDNLLGD